MISAHAGKTSLSDMRLINKYLKTKTLKPHLCKGNIPDENDH